MAKKYPRTTKLQKCTKCGETKPADEFHSMAARPSGLVCWCKKCRQVEKCQAKKYPRSTEPKKCPKCEVVKQAEEFYANTHDLSGLSSWCKACDRARKRSKKYPRSTEPKKCTKCSILKEAEGFYSEPGNRDGLQGRCKVCESFTQRLRKYGITPKTHLLMLGAQSYECVCGEPLTLSSHTDHCHTTGRIRNILCNNCNLLIGLAKDDPTLLQKHADELRRHQQLEAQGTSRWGYVPQ